MLAASSLHPGHDLLHEAAGKEGGGDEAGCEELGGGEDAAHEQHVGERPAQPGGELRQRGASAALGNLTQSAETENI